MALKGMEPATNPQ